MGFVSVPNAVLIEIPAFSGMTEGGAGMTAGVENK